MTQLQIISFAIILVVLIMLAAFFSAAETSLMVVNRYRLRHQAKLKRRSAITILKLLKRPDRLLGLILIGNNTTNIIASALATLIAAHFWGEKGALLTSIVLTLVILIFAEVAPKTIAAIYPEQVSKWVALPISVLLTIFNPLVQLINGLSNSLLRLLRIKVTSYQAEPLNQEELRTVVYETAGRFSRDYQKMLLGILDLNKVSVNDVMVPKHHIRGIDLEWSWAKIQKAFYQSEYDWLPVYRENINQVVGILHIRELMHHCLENTLDKEVLNQLMHEPYFVPEGTPLNIQLLNFQRTRQKIALVVDEYGDIHGLVTVVDILEEIVGEFTTTLTSSSKLIQKQTDGSYLVEGGITVRELNRFTHWALPTHEARTLNGLIVNTIESIPKTGIGLMIANHPIEIIEVKNNRVKIARIFPALVNQ